MGYSRTDNRWHMTLLVLSGLACLTSCQLANVGKSMPALESQASSSFIENCHQLRKSDGFRQNVWLCGHMADSAAICMDLDRRLYLVVRSERPARSQNQIDGKYRRLQVTPETLRSRMDPEAFILDGGAVGEKLVGIFHIPDDAGESFGIELINHLLNLELKAEDLDFQWD